MKNDSTRGYPSERTDTTRFGRPVSPGHSKSIRYEDHRPSRRRTEPASTTQNPDIRRQQSLNSVHSWLNSYDNDAPILRTSSPQENDYDTRLLPISRESRQENDHYDRRDRERNHNHQYPDQDLGYEQSESSVILTPPSSPDIAKQSRKPYIQDNEDWSSEDYPANSQYEANDGDRRQTVRGSYYDKKGRLTHYITTKGFALDPGPEESRQDVEHRRPRRKFLSDDQQSFDRYDDEQGAPASAQEISDDERYMYESRRDAPVQATRHEYREAEGHYYEGEDDEQTYDQPRVDYSRRDLGSADDTRGTRHGMPTPSRTPLNQGHHHGRDGDYPRRREDHSPTQSVSSYYSERSHSPPPRTRDEPSHHYRERSRSPIRDDRDEGQDRSYRSESNYDRARSESPPSSPPRESRDNQIQSRDPSPRHSMDNHRDDSSDTDSSIEYVPRKRSQRRTKSFVILQLRDSDSEDDGRESRQYVGPKIRTRDLAPSALRSQEREEQASQQVTIMDIATQLRKSLGGSNVRSMYMERGA